MEQDYQYLAYSLSSLAGLPVRLYLNGSFSGLYHHTKFKPDLAILQEERIFQNPGNVSYYMDENFLCYGLFRVKEEPAALLIGPVTQAAVDRSTVSRILRTMGENPSRIGELTEYLTTMPAYPLRSFLQILCTVNYFINREKLDVGQLVLSGDMPELPEIPSAARYKEERSTTIHNTFELEERMLAAVKYGRVEEIRALFRRPAEGRAGIMASDALRQEKNLLICTATLVTRAAIQGGLDQETAFSLSDIYIQKAELLDDYVALTRLNARMVLDFTQRVETAKCGTNNTGLIRDARNYIFAHINETITTDALSRVLGLNRTYLCKLFLQETGLTVNHFVTSVKLEEAKRLMDVTSKSIAEIAEYLGYSSQSYFQKVFKKHISMTPGEYRTGQVSHTNHD